MNANVFYSQWRSENPHLGHDPIKFAEAYLAHKIEEAEKAYREPRMLQAKIHYDGYMTALNKLKEL